MKKKERIKRKIIKLFRGLNPTEQMLILMKMQLFHNLNPVDLSCVNGIIIGTPGHGRMIEACENGSDGAFAEQRTHTKDEFGIEPSPVKADFNEDMKGK